MTTKMKSRLEKPMQQKWSLRAAAALVFTLLMTLGLATPSYAANGESIRFANIAANTARITIQDGVAVIAGNTMVIRDDTWQSSEVPVETVVTVEVNSVPLPLPLGVYPIKKYNNTGQINYTTGCDPNIGTITAGQSYTVVVTASSQTRGTLVDTYTLVAPDWVKWFPSCPETGPITD